MLAEISATYTALNAAAKAAAAAFKTVQDTKTREAIADIQNNLLDVQAKLLAAHSQYEAVAEAKRQLEQKIMEYEKWDTESARYKLQEVASGIFVYVLQPDHAIGEPIHWLCPNCFQRREKSILTKPTVDHLNYKCHRCSFDVGTKTAYPPSSDFSSSGYGMGDLGDPL